MVIGLFRREATNHKQKEEHHNSSQLLVKNLKESINYKGNKCVTKIVCPRCYDTQSIRHTVDKAHRAGG